MKFLLVSAVVLLLPLIIASSASGDMVKPDASSATITFECELYLKAGQPIKVLDCKAVGLEPHLSSGE